MSRDKTTMMGAFVIALGLSACQDREPTPDEPFDLIEPTEDAGADAEPDTGEDAGEPDTGPEVLREVIEVSLFGDMPLDNGFKDPIFGSLGTGFTWIAQPTTSQGQLATSIRARPPGAPVDAPALRLLRDANTPRDVSIYGELTLKRQPTQVSVWLGRAEPENATYLDMEVQLVGLDLSDPTGFSGVELQEQAEDRVRSGNILWRRYAANVTTYAGFAYLVAREPAGADLYVLAPTSTFTPVRAGALLTAPTPSRRLTAQESAHITRVTDEVTAQRQRRFSQEKARMLPTGIGPIPVPAN